MRGSASRSQARGSPAPSPGQVFQPALTSWLLLHPQHCLEAVASLVQGALGFFFSLSVRWKTLLLSPKLHLQGGLLEAGLVVS